MTTMLSMLSGWEVGLIGSALCVGCACTVFWIWALIHCARRVSAGESCLVGWLIAICLLHLLGALAYVIFAPRSAGPMRSVQPAVAT